MIERTVHPWSTGHAVAAPKMVCHSVRTVRHRRRGAGRFCLPPPIDRAHASGSKRRRFLPIWWQPAPVSIATSVCARCLSSFAVPTVLERVAREERLVDRRSLDQVVQGLIDRIQVEVPPPIARTQNDPQLDAFDIVYLDRTGERAQRVADKLAQVFVEENTRSREVAGRRHDRVPERTAARLAGSHCGSREASADGERTAHGQAAGTDAGESPDARPASAVNSSRPATDPRRSRIGCRCWIASCSR